MAGKRAKVNKIKNSKLADGIEAHDYPEKDEERGLRRWQDNKEWTKKQFWGGPPPWYIELNVPRRTLYPGETVETSLDYTRQMFNGWWLMPREDKYDRGGGDFAPPATSFDLGVKVWPVEFFKKNRKILAYEGTEAKTINNRAMKFFRDQCEYKRGVPSDYLPLGLDLTFPQFDVVAMELPFMIHDGGETGDWKELKTTMSWSWEYSGLTSSWGWQRMLAALPDECLDELVGKDDGASRGGGVRGIYACKLMPRLGSYDHKRHNVYAQEGRPIPKGTIVPLWDFVFFTTHGNIVGLRPAWMKTHFDVHYYRKGGLPVALEEDRLHMLGPPGQSMGEGTYARYKRMEVDTSWKALSWAEISRR